MLRHPILNDTIKYGEQFVVKIIHSVIPRKVVDINEMIRPRGRVPYKIYTKQSEWKNLSQSVHHLHDKGLRRQLCFLEHTAGTVLSHIGYTPEILKVGPRK